ncbi:MAG: Ldh family oxidoreductase [Pseudomonadales bacterium]
MSKVTVSIEDIRQKSMQCLLAHGAEQWVAEEMANAISYAESRHNPICGLYYLDSYCAHLRNGRVNGSAEPHVSQPKASAVHIDAKDGFAQPAFKKGITQAIAIAKENGTCSLAISDAYTPTAIGYFTDQIAAAGLMGIGFANAPACVAPPGGSSAVLGTNPIAMSVPARDGGVAFHFDQSTTVVIIGKIRVAAAAGEKIPTHWAVDKHGAPTDDPNAALDGGSLAFAGEHKGYGISLMVELLAAAVTGSLSSTKAPPLKAAEGPAHGLGQFFFLLDPTTFSGEAFFDQLEALMQTVESQPNARLPGESQIETEIALDSALWDKVNTLAQG